MKLSICIYMCMFEWCGDGKAIRPTVSGAVCMYVCLSAYLVLFFSHHFFQIARQVSIEAEQRGRMVFSVQQELVKVQTFYVGLTPRFGIN